MSRLMLRYSLRSWRVSKVRVHEYTLIFAALLHVRIVKSYFLY